ncbi:MAG: FlgO family outer membrane protein [Blastocatellia bacterium]
MTGATISHYRILEHLGTGGMGEVYKAEDTRLHRFAALKVMQPALYENEEARARFLREARTAATLNHPHIATVYEIDEYEHEGQRRSFIAMEYVAGLTLGEYARTRTLSVTRRLELIEQIAEALAEAHQAGVVHRDIKPSNVLVNEQQRIKVLDFGLAKFERDAGPEFQTISEFHTALGGAGRVLGTVAYMSPEQALGGDIDHRTDIFSLGIVAYEILSGRLPFAGRTALAISDAILHVDPAPLGLADEPLSADIERIIRRMLARDRATRYQRMREVIAELYAVQWQIANPPASTRILPAHNPVFTDEIDPFRTHVGLTAGALITPGPHTRTMQARAGKSIAVMNFVNITRNADDEWLGAGIAETVTADLKKIEGVTVIGRELVYQVMRNLSGDASETRRSDFDEQFAAVVGHEVGARYTIGGGYQHIGEMVRITARIVEVETGEVSGTVKIDGRMSELFDLQDRVVVELSRTLRLGLQSGEQEGIQQQETRVMEAYEALTRGMIEAYALSSSGMNKAREYFEQALALDPGYARAHAMLGFILEAASQFDGKPELRREAVEHLQKAIELQPMLPESYHWLGMAFLDEGREDDALGAIRRALAFAPNDPEAHGIVGRIYMLGRGDFHTAAEAYEKSVQLNTRNGWIAMQLAQCCAYTGAYERGISAALRAIEAQESYTLGSQTVQVVGAYQRLGQLYTLQGRYPEAISEFYREIGFLHKTNHSLADRVSIETFQRLASAYVRIGKQDLADIAWGRMNDVFTERLRAGQDEPFTRYYIACGAAMMGDQDKALENLAIAVTGRRAFTIARMRREPDLEGLRDDPRFQALVAGK